MTLPTPFEAQICFHEMALESSEIEMEKLNFVGNVVNSTLAGIVVQLVQKNFD